MNHLEKIEEIKNHPYVSIADIFESKDDYWEYFYRAVGWYKGNYFSVIFSKSKRNEPNIKVSVSTNEREKFIKDFGLCH